MISMQEHITGLFIAGFVYWWRDDESAAITCWQTAVQVLNSNVACVGET